MIKVEGLKCSVRYDREELKAALCKSLRVRKSDIRDFTVVKEALDARKKPRLYKVVTVKCSLYPDEDGVLKKCVGKASRAEQRPYELPENRYNGKYRPIVVGAGPGGLFGALVLAKAGLNPLVIEGGKASVSRKEDILSFCNGGAFLPQSNIQFGEGGAGMFSDGKLNTGTKDIRHRFIIETMIRCGAPAEIGYLAKPHVGSDYLGAVSSAIREEISALGGSFFFETRLSGLRMENGHLAAVEVEREGKKEEISCDRLLLAVGHSARNTVETLFSLGMEMERKPFSVGARIEHLQREIDIAQFGRPYPGLTADYKLSAHLENGRSVYTFCMCPGGVVVPAASEADAVVTNGMSEWARDTEKANSALLVSVRPDDFPGEGPLAGIRFQRELEQKAFALGGGGYFAPAQRVEDFLLGRKTEKWGKVLPSYRPGVTPCDLRELFPSYVTESLKQALPILGKKLKGFDDGDAVLTAVETRSSAPFRMVRDENGMSSLFGVFPAGEGSGYAGGIMSSAADGMRIAEKIMKNV